MISRRGGGGKDNPEFTPDAQGEERRDENQHVNRAKNFPLLDLNSFAPVYTRSLLCFQALRRIGIKI